MKLITNIKKLLSKVVNFITEKVAYLISLIVIPQDRANHFFYGFVIFFLSDLFLKPQCALGIVLIFAIVKETKDRWYGGEFDYKDLIAGMLPGILLTLKQLIQ